jgi:hypothetical protein
MTTQEPGGAGRARALLALAGALLALAVTPALAAAHDGHGRVSGTYAVTDFGTTQCALKGASPDILECSTTGFKSAYEGSLVGTVETSFTQVINCTTGRTRGHGVETFTGTLNGSGTGTLTWKISFHAAFDCATSVPSDFHGLARIKASSGALSGSHGKLRFGDVTYDGKLRR